MDKSEFLPTYRLGSQGLQKLLYHARLNIGVLKIVSMWDEGQGWSSGRAAAVWSSLGERARRWLGEGPKRQKREEAGWRKPLGIAIWGDYHSETVCGLVHEVGATGTQTEQCLWSTPQTTLQNYLLCFKEYFLLWNILGFLAGSRVCVCLYASILLCINLSRKKLKNLKNTLMWMESGVWHDVILHGYACDPCEAH